MATVTKIDWLEAKKYYVENNRVSLRDVALKFGTTTKSVEDHSAKEGWVNLRQQVGVSATTAIVEKAADERVAIVNEHALKFAQTENITVAMMNRLARKLRRLEQTDPDALLDDKSYMSPQQWSYLVQALKVSTDGRRTALGLPVTITKSEGEVSVLNPYQGYNPSQLRKIIEQNETEMRAKYAR